MWPPQPGTWKQSWRRAASSCGESRSRSGPAEQDALPWDPPQLRECFRRVADRPEAGARGDLVHVPLRGMAGHCGGLHSFLVVTVSADTSGTKTYVLEKAGSQANLARQRNGIFVGSQDLSSNLKSVEGLKMHKTQLSLSDGSLRRGLRMKELYEKAYGTGPYHLATSNCHHAAQMRLQPLLRQRPRSGGPYPQRVVARGGRNSAGFLVRLQPLNFRIGFRCCFLGVRTGLRQPACRFSKWLRSAR